MHFYQFNIGDFAKKTQHLTNEEELAYRRALDMYYDTENPLLTTGLATLSRRLRVNENALKNVLEEFFPDGKNKCADEKIAEYYTFLERQKANGSKGGRPKHKPSANPVVSQNNPVPTQPLPITNNQEPLKSNTLVPDDVGDCPHKEIINLYHKHLPMLTQVKHWTDKRAEQLKIRWRESPERHNLAFWERLFKYIAESDFLTGKTSDWQADLEWITKSTNFIKIIEGKYENKVKS